jgi:hypothetical protein
MNKILTSLVGLAAGTASALVAGPAVACGGTEPPPCHNADLHASYHYDSSATSHTYWNLVLKNVSDHACVTGGFGGLSFVGHGDGTQIGASADRVGSYQKYLVKPGQRLVSAVSQTSTGPYSRSYCRPTPIDGFRVYVPNATKSQYIPHSGTACANAAVHLLSHRSYVRP